MKLSRHELMEVSLRGEIGGKCMIEIYISSFHPLIVEAQWVATAALGILHEEHKDLHKDSQAK